MSYSVKRFRIKKLYGYWVVEDRKTQIVHYCDSWRVAVGVVYPQGTIPAQR